MAQAINRPSYARSPARLCDGRRRRGREGRMHLQQLFLHWCCSLMNRLSGKWRQDDLLSLLSAVFADGRPPKRMAVALPVEAKTVRKRRQRDDRGAVAARERLACRRAEHDLHRTQQAAANGELHNRIDLSDRSVGEEAALNRSATTDAATRSRRLPTSLSRALDRRLECPPPRRQMGALYTCSAHVLVPVRLRTAWAAAARIAGGEYVRR